MTLFFCENEDNINNINITFPFLGKNSSNYRDKLIELSNEGRGSNFRTFK